MYNYIKILIIFLSDFLAKDNYVKLEPNTRINTSSDGKLTISDIVESDESSYRCEADNGVEKSLTAEIRLTVYGKISVWEFVIIKIINTFILIFYKAVYSVDNL